MCVGTPEGNEVQRALDMPDVLDDLDVAFDSALLRNPQLDLRNKRRLIEVGWTPHIGVLV